MVIAVCDDSACTGGNDTFVLDNGAGDTIGAAGAASTSLSAFGYSLVVNTSQSKPIIGSATAPQLDLNFAATTNDSLAHSIFLFVSDTDFLTGGFDALTIGGTNSGGSGTVTGRAWGGSNNTALSFSPANLLGLIGPETGASFAGSTNGSFNPAANPFSLTIGAAINRSTAGTSTGDLNFSVAAVPEPSTWAMMLVGFGGIGFAMRRKKTPALQQIA